MKTESVLDYNAHLREDVQKIIDTCKRLGITCVIAIQMESGEFNSAYVSLQIPERFELADEMLYAATILQNGKLEGMKRIFLHEAAQITKNGTSALLKF